MAPGVLIPRPETAELVDLIVRENPQAARLLDIGTGSGCIAISLDKRLPEAAVDAWDVSEDALAVARANNKELEANVALKKIDVLSDAQTEPECEVPVYDVIVSNPPYVTECEKQTMEPNVLDGNRSRRCLFPIATLCGFIAGLPRWGERCCFRKGSCISKSIALTDGKPPSCSKGADTGMYV